MGISYSGGKWDVSHEKTDHKTDYRTDHPTNLTYTTNHKHCWWTIKCKWYGCWPVRKCRSWTETHDDTAKNNENRIMNEENEKNNKENDATNKKNVWHGHRNMGRSFYCKSF